MGAIYIEDASLINDYISGNEKALASLIKRHQSKVYGFISSKIGNRDISDDIFQDTFIKVIQTLKSDAYKEEGKFLPWVMRIAHNLVIDYYRKSQKMPMLRETEDFSIFSFMSDEVSTIEAQLVSEQIEGDLRKIIDNLPADQQEVLVMRFYQDMSFKEISESTGVSINTALGRMRYALLNIRKLVDKHQIILAH